MLKLNLQKVFMVRNITKPSTFLGKMGINHYSARNYTNGSQRIVGLDLIEKICIELHCTPNDLLEWIPEKEIQDHPMNQLKSSDIASIAQKLRNIPFDKLSGLNDWFNQQK